MDTISVIVPIYNVEPYLERCIKSILHQTFSDIEIILVNDGSTDRSEEICLSYAEKYKRIRYFKKRNGGLSDARNYGLERASGNYIGFVDSDDWTDPEMYHVLYDDMIKYNADISACNYEMITGSEIQSTVIDNEVEILDRENAVKRLLKKNGYADYAWNKLYKKELFDDIRFPAGKRMEDLGTTYKVFLKADRVTYNNGKYYKYYQRDDSILHRPTKGFYEDQLELALKRYEVLRKLYPDMRENTIFFLNTAYGCLPYLDKETDLFINTVKEVTSVEKECIKDLNIKKRIKSCILSISPTMFMWVFKKKYE